jgi:choline dehydrogenase-like flavoprotein
MDTQFDAIVVGSGITGGWAAKELTQRGLKVLMIERGRMIEHQSGYTKETLAPWELPFHGRGDAALFARDYAVQSQQKLFFNEWTQDHWVNDRENPYQTAPGDTFIWFRGYQLGGKSLLWGRQCYRWADIDFAANKTDGHGVDWPIRYKDVAPWYDHVEDFIGVSGSVEGLDVLPDGKFLPPMKLNAAERLIKAKLEGEFPGRKLIIGRSANITQQVGDRSPCQYRGICARGCSYGAYFSTQSSTLPAAQATGRLTLLTDTIVEQVLTDSATGRATGVRTRGTKDAGRQTFTGKLIFLNAGTINTVALLLRSRCDHAPAGLANSSGTLGHYLMDHGQASSALGLVQGVDDRTYWGNRPNGIVVPRFRNLHGQEADFLRGYSYQGGALRRGWNRGGESEGLGASLKNRLDGPGEWMVTLGAFAECLPDAANRITLHPTAVDSLGMPQVEIAFKHGDNTRRALQDAAVEASRMLQAAGVRVLATSADVQPGGTAIHEMGGARMGADPASAVVNGWNQTHDVPNLFITDGACMSSTACQNPSLTYMALTARACDYAVKRLKAAAL